MTQTEYGVKVTEIIDNATGGNFEYPEGFEAEVAGFFRDRLPAQIAAESVMAGVFSKEEPESTETLVCGNQVQEDKSGVGHHWVNVNACDLPANIVEELEGEMIDGGMSDGGEMTGSNGTKYRW